MKEKIQKADTGAGDTMKIPASSPYYERLIELRSEIGCVPEDSQEHRFLECQIEELEHRARKHMRALQYIETL